GTKHPEKSPGHQNRGLNVLHSVYSRVYLSYFSFYCKLFVFVDLLSVRLPAVCGKADFDLLYTKRAFVASGDFGIIFFHPDALNFSRFI
ncbi:MAG: hypothetical protein KBE95_05025, partial [Clostridium sp.]|nr:hypothetical protein [Clostridium sp.]